MLSTIKYDAKKSLNDKAIIINFKCMAKSCEWKKEESVSDRVYDIKDNHSIICRVGKQWAVDNGQWCSEKMDPVLMF